VAYGCFIKKKIIVSSKILMMPSASRKSQNQARVYAERYCRLFLQVLKVDK
jgi:hypothetical protein